MDFSADFSDKAPRTPSPTSVGYSPSPSPHLSQNFKPVEADTVRIFSQDDDQYAWAHNNNTQVLPPASFPPPSSGRPSLLSELYENDGGSPEQSDVYNDGEWNSTSPPGTTAGAGASSNGAPSASSARTHDYTLIRRATFPYARQERPDDAMGVYPPPPFLPPPHASSHHAHGAGPLYNDDAAGMHGAADGPYGGASGYGSEYDSGVKVEDGMYGGAGSRFYGSRGHGMHSGPGIVGPGMHDVHGGHSSYAGPGAGYGGGSANGGHMHHHHLPPPHPHLPAHHGGHHGHHAPHGHPYPPPLPVQHTDDAASKETQYLRRRCFNCHTTEPPSWRRSTLNPGKIVCNKCGLYERTHLRARPLRFDELRAGGKGRKNSKGVLPGTPPMGAAPGSPPKGRKVIGRRGSVSSNGSSVQGASDWDDSGSMYSSGPSSSHHSSYHPSPSPSLGLSPHPPSLSLSASNSSHGSPRRDSLSRSPPLMGSPPHSAGLLGSPSLGIRLPHAPDIPSIHHGSPRMSSMPIRTKPRSNTTGGLGMGGAFYGSGAIHPGLHHSSSSSSLHSIHDAHAHSSPAIRHQALGSPPMGHMTWDDGLVKEEPRSVLV
ncbi:unnamed protein product [Mycena citricolor]|uniref:GATA-type domain-containing protein n=1 Tax=Mycena citricolor TaxID=2018698 RepID=A0AAD2GVP4_9AGAR|nr:unnamed protein product [Mycena citricolor]